MAVTPEIQKIITATTEQQISRNDKPMVYVEPPSASADQKNISAIIQKYKDRIRSPMTAIRSFCIGCSNGSIKEVDECRVVNCSLWPLRLGKNTYHKKSKAYQEAHAEDVDEAEDND